jgi:hypothetical protein
MCGLAYCASLFGHTFPSAHLLAVSFANISVARKPPRCPGPLRPRESAVPGQNLSTMALRDKGVIRQEAERGYPVTAISNTPYSARLDSKAYRRCFSYTFLEVRRETREGNKKPPPQETEKGLIPRADRKARKCSLCRTGCPHSPKLQHRAP